MSSRPHTACLVTLAIVAAGLLPGCSPVYNWREVSLDPAPLRAMLPCKPDRAVRTVPLGGVAREIAMSGCEAGGQTFAVASVRVNDASQGQAVIAQWRAATTAGMRSPAAGTVLVRSSGGGTPAVAQRSGGRLVKAGGEEVQVDAVWFAQGLVVYQAMVLGPAKQPAAARESTETFLEGLRFP